MRKAVLHLLLLFAVLPALAQAWWNPDWSERRKITLNTAPEGVALKEAAVNALVAVRLHTGNFAFAEAKEDGADIRFIGADDKTPLKFHFESFDSIDELAVAWVLVPRLDPGAKDQHLWIYFGNAKAPAAGEAKGSYDPAQLAALHFSESGGAPQDSTAYGHHAAQSTAKLGIAGLLAGGAALESTGRIVIPAAPSFKAGAEGFTFSAWLKPAAGEGALFDWGGAKGVRIALARNGVVAQGFGGEARGGKVKPGVWQHIAVTRSADRLVVYLNGVEAASAEAQPAPVEGEAVIGGGYAGEIDEVQLAAIARSPDWVRAAAFGQGGDAKLVSFGAPETTAGGGTSYFTILLGAVTIDGWIVIGILAVMAVISFWVMLKKGMLLASVERMNERFIEKFRAVGGADPATLTAEDDAHMAGSTLYRVYQTGTREFRSRFDNGGALTAKGLDAIKATLDASQVRETQRLSSQMVLLTIAISGGPFLGLLGTVVGVMITFAAIAATGDINVNSIAPGIAAALVATVAGLGVAIPALFGYNYLASRIKNITADMQVFVDEFITRLAETHMD